MFRALFPLGIALWALIALPAPSQQPNPVFSPPAGAERKNPASEKAAPGGDEGAASAEAPQEVDGLAALVERLRRWPNRRAREAALMLAGLGEESKVTLIAGLRDNDWRIQSGCAFALAEMGAVDAAPALTTAIEDPSNRAGLPELMRALIRLAPREGPAVVMPFLSHSSSRVRRAAVEAMPDALDSRYLPDAVALCRSERAAVRETALALLARIGGAEEKEAFFLALADPEPRVASAAARHLGRRGSAKARQRLQELSRTAPLRQATYAMLALVYAEDTFGEALIPEEGEIRDRAMGILRSGDAFYRGAGAIVLANLGYRSVDPALRQLSDRYLVPIILGTVAGGVFFSDYASLEHLAWMKLELLSGETFGPDAVRWRAWWEKAQEGFLARRELRQITVKELEDCEIAVLSQVPDAPMVQMLFTGDAAVLGDPDPGAPLVLDDEDRLELKELLDETGFFTTRGEPRDPARGDEFTEFCLRRGALQYRRFHHGSAPASLSPLYQFLDRRRRELSWQRFAPRGTLAERRAYLDTQREFFRTEENPVLRRQRLQELAVVAYPDLPRSTRSLAVSVLKEADPEWIRDNRERVLACLKHESALTDESAELIEIAAQDAHKQIRDAVVEMVSTDSSAFGDDVMRRFLAQQPMPGVVALMTDERARIRALAAEALGRFPGESGIVDVLIGGLRDYEPRVRDACVKSLASMDDARVLTMLGTIIEGDDRSLRVRAIRALGAVGRDQAVPRLMEIYRSGDDRDRWAVVQALKEAGGRRGVVQLTGIVRETGPLELRKEAFEALVSLGGTDVAERLAEIIEVSAEAEIRGLAVGGLARVIGKRALPTILPLLEAEDPGVRRIATLVAARLGASEAIPSLIHYMSSLEGDRAAEQAFAALTFFASRKPAPSMRARDAQGWVDRYGTLSRLEWFLMETKAEGVELDPAIEWLDTSELTPVQAMVALRLLTRAKPGPRLALERTLLRVSGLDLEPLPFASTEAEVNRRVAVYRRWIDDNR